VVISYSQQFFITIRELNSLESSIDTVMAQKLSSINLEEFEGTDVSSDNKNITVVGDIQSSDGSLGLKRTYSLTRVGVPKVDDFLTGSGEQKITIKVEFDDGDWLSVSSQ